MNRIVQVIKYNEMHWVNPWVSTRDLKKRMHERDALKAKAVRSKDINDWARFKKSDNAVNNEVKLSKQNYYECEIYRNEGNL